MIKIKQITIAIVLALASMVQISTPVQAISCDDAKFIFARGSGEELNGDNAGAWREEITKQVAGSGLSFGFYELGEYEQGGYRYDAVAVSGSVSGIATLVGAKVSAGESFKFGRSVKEGEQELLTYIQAVNLSCPNTKFVLGGYSQGAMLISHALSSIDSDKIIYVATFGDPKTYLPEGKGNFPDACLGKNLSNYRAYVSDCHAYEGILGSYRPYQPEGYYDKIGLWCNGQDAMCSSGLSIDAHISYVDNGMYKRAAAKIAERIKAAFPQVTQIPPDPSESSTADVAIILDTSPSMMQDPYNIYLNRIRQVVNEVRSLGGRVALFYYGDYRYFPARCVCDFETCTEEKINNFYNQYAEIGIIGHWRYNSGISAAYKALTELNWRSESPKSIIIFTNQDLSSQNMSADYLLEANQIVGAQISIYTARNGAISYDGLVKETGGKLYSEDFNAGALSSDITDVAPTELPNTKYVATIQQEIFFDASQVALELKQQKTPSLKRRMARSLRSALHYDWDLDGDGIFEIIDGDEKISTRYNQAKQGFVQVRVRDEVGNYRTAISEVEILPEFQGSDISATELKVDLEQIDEKSYRLDFDTTAHWLLVGIDDVILGKINPQNPPHLTIEDVDRPTTVRLTVLSESGERGQTVELKLGTNLPEIDEESSGTEDNNTPISSPTLPNVSRPTIFDVVSDSSQLTHFVINSHFPKVPNAGVVNVS